MAEEEREGLTDFRRATGLQLRHDLAVAFAGFEARHFAGIQPVDQDPAAYVRQAEAQSEGRAGGEDAAEPPGAWLARYRQPERPLTGLAPGGPWPAQPRPAGRRLGPAPVRGGDRAAPITVAGAGRDLERELGQAAGAAAAALAGRAPARRRLPAGDQAGRRGVRRPARRMSWPRAATRSRARRGAVERGGDACPGSGSTTSRPACPARPGFPRARGPGGVGDLRRASGCTRCTCPTAANPTPITTGTSWPGWPRCGRSVAAGPGVRRAAAT